MQNVISTLPSIILHLLLYIILAVESLEDYASLSCGALLGGHRYCLDYSNRSLLLPPDGSNITTILDLSYNKIKTIARDKFKSQRLLMKLDLSHNEIVNIDPTALLQLRSLSEINLGNNPYICEYAICPFRNWLDSNKRLVKDVDDVTCSGPQHFRGRKVVDAEIASEMCRNGTIHHGFEINTGTVFMIWIVVPIMITTLTAFYIVLNGNNRFGRTVRGCFVACCERTMPARRSDLSPERENNQGSRAVFGGNHGNHAREHFSESLSGDENLAPVESVGQLEMEEVRPGPSNSSSSSFW
ncbi:hypothetical protein ACHWQZ_G004584 [Mnemiopsis leidyi]